MSKKILLQVGHLNIENLTKTGLRNWRNVSSLKRSTGSKGERDYFEKKVVPELKKLLEKIGINVTVTDAIYHKDLFKKRFDLCISMHYDGGGTENRCMISSPKRNLGYLNDGAHDIADDFCRIWKDNYPELTGTINRDNRITIGMQEYYWFDYVEMDSPAVIIEHFNSTSDQGKKLINDYKNVAKADYECILKFFGINDSKNDKDGKIIIPDDNDPFNFDVTKRMPDDAWEELGFGKREGIDRDWALDTIGEEFEKLYNNSKKINNNNDKLEEEIKGLVGKINKLKKENDLCKKECASSMSVKELFSILMKKLNL